ncbi:MAG: hypothetical protein WDN46_17840 [Methylocella sp.]
MGAKRLFIRAVNVAFGLTPRETFLLMITDRLFTAFTLVSAFVLGNYTTPSTAIWNLHAAQARRRQSKNGGEAAEAQTSDRQQKLKEALLEIFKSQKFKTGEKFASIIRPKVFAYLGLPPGKDGWPAPGTIKAAD